jgi:hypothetical protein
MVDENKDTNATDDTQSPETTQETVVAEVVPAKADEAQQVEDDVDLQKRLAWTKDNKSELYDEISGNAELSHAEITIMLDDAEVPEAEDIPEAEPVDEGSSTAADVEAAPADPLSEDADTDAEKAKEDAEHSGVANKNNLQENTVETSTDVQLAELDKKPLSKQVLSEEQDPEVREQNEKDLQARLGWAEANNAELFKRIDGDDKLSYIETVKMLDNAKVPQADAIEADGNDAKVKSTVPGELPLKQDAKDDLAPGAITEGDAIASQPSQSTEVPVSQTPLNVSPAKEPTTPVSPSDLLGDNSVASTDSTPSNTNLPIVVARMQDVLDIYVKDMATSRPNTSADGANLQRALYRAIHGVVYAKANGDFTAGMQLLFDTIDEHQTGVFKERYAFRYFSNLSLAKTERLEFENWMRLFLNVAPKDGRKESLAQTDVNAALHYTTNADVKERLMTYIKKVTS